MKYPTPSADNTSIASKKQDTDIIKTGIVLLVIASSVFFFRLIFLDIDFIYIIQFATIILLCLLLIFQVIYWNIPIGKHHFTTPLLLIFTGVFLSMLTANIEHNQGFMTSLWAQRFMYFYLFYFVLHILQLPAANLEKLLFFTGVAYALAFILQYIAYPKLLFAVRHGVERGTIRIFIPGLFIMNIAYFIAFTRILFNNSFKYIPYILLFYCVYILSGTRSVIAGPTVVTIVILIFSNKIKSKALIILLVMAVVGVTFYMFQDIILNLVSISREQTAHSAEDIRVRAARFFLNDFFPSKVAYITGNGEGHLSSAFGREVHSYKVHYGYYQSDIGIIGEYTKYGAMFLIGATILTYKGIMTNIGTNFNYIRYFFILLLISAPLGLFFTLPDSIVPICILLYIIDYQKNKQPALQKRPLVYFPEFDNPHNDIE
ncbi:MAG: hypothetical protein R6U04_04725 [Bacteroidales bacterium]